MVNSGLFPDLNVKKILLVIVSNVRAADKIIETCNFCLYDQKISCLIDSADWRRVICVRYRFAFNVDF
jgi:hypothetical protein